MLNTTSQKTQMGVVRRLPWYPWHYAAVLYKDLPVPSLLYLSSMHACVRTCNSADVSLHLLLLVPSLPGDAITKFAFTRWKRNDEKGT